MAIISEVGNGKNTLFWTDRWLHGQSVAQLAPNLFGIPSKRAKKRIVHEALNESRWVQDIQGALTVTVLSKYLNLWDLVSEVALQPEVDDSYLAVLYLMNIKGVPSAESSRSVRGLGKSVSGKPYPRLCNARRPRL